MVSAVLALVVVIVRIGLPLFFPLPMTGAGAFEIGWMEDSLTDRATSDGS